MEAHNGMSARIAEEAGFEAIWASGLSISASHAVRDRNEASWTQILEVLEFMADAVSVPVLFDGDSGFGDFNNVRRLVVKLEQRGAGGVCIEDKLFPKKNSFLGAGQELEAIPNYCAKIRAAKDAQSDADFVVVARTETLIAGRSMAEALERAECYVEAGADAILIHSKKSTGDEIFEFRSRWTKATPVVIVPTTYHKTPTTAFDAAGISAVIWANHSMRASLLAMQKVCQIICKRRSVSDIEPEIASIAEVFRLCREHDVEELERKYFDVPQPDGKGKADPGPVSRAG